MSEPGLAIFDTHPVQYRVPVYAALERDFGVPVTQYYASDFSIAGYFDREFQTSFAWPSNVLEGAARAVYFSRSRDGGARSFEEVTPRGVAEAVRRLAGRPVLVTGYAPSFYRHVLFYALRYRCPILFRAETIDLPMSRGWLKEAARDAWLRFVYGRCDRLLPIGIQSTRHYRRLGCPPEKLVDAPYCVNSSLFECDENARTRLRNITRDRLGLPPDALAILMSGKVYARKNPLLLVQAVRLLPEHLRHRVALIFLGDGEQRKAVEALAAESPAIRVHITGFCNQNELSPYFHAADLLAMPSQWETWGLSVNDSLHHGLPCVVSETVGCHPDLIEPGVTGEVTEANSAGALAAGLQRLITWMPPGENGAALRERCRAKVAGYSTAKAAEGIVRAYRSLIG